MTGTVLSKVAPPKHFGERLKFYEGLRQKNIREYQQMVKNRQQLMCALAVCVAETFNVIIEDGGYSERARKMIDIKTKMAKMADVMTDRIDSFVINHGWFPDQNA